MLEANRLTANLLLGLGTFLSVIWIAYGVPLLARHTHQHFIYGLSFSSLNVDGTLPANMIRFIDSERGFQERLKRAQERQDRRKGVERVPFWKEGTSRESDNALLELNPEDRRSFTVAPSVVHYSAVGYIPIILSGSLGHWFEWKPLWIYNGSVYLSMFLPLIAGYFILLLLPCFHWPVLLLLLLPSVFNLRFMLYPDTSQLVASFAFFTLLVRALYYRKPLTLLAVLGFVVTSVSMTLIKLAYLPLVLAVAIIPTQCFSSRYWKFAFVGLVVLISFGALALQSSASMKNDYVNIDLKADVIHAISTAPWAGGTQTLDELVPGWRKSDDTSWQVPEGRRGALFYLVHRPHIVAKRMLNNFTDDREFRELLWSVQAWCPCRLQGLKNHEWPRTIVLGLIMLAVFAGSALGANHRMRAGAQHGSYGLGLGLLSRCFIVSLFVGSTILILTALFIVTPAFKNGTIDGMQGRYLLPALPFLLLVLPQIPRRFEWLAPYLTIVVAGLTLLALLVAYTSPFTPYAMLYGD